MVLANGFYNQRDIEAAAKIDLIAEAAQVEPKHLHDVLSSYISNTPDIISALAVSSPNNWEGMKLGWNTPEDMMLEVVAEAKLGHRNHTQKDKRKALDRTLTDRIKSILEERW
jgi:hypothetical protein